MNSELPEEKANQTYGLVGDAYSGTRDQTPRFLDEGIWENGYADKYLELVKSMQPGDPIAIKATFVRKANYLE